MRAWTVLAALVVVGWALALALGWALYSAASALGLHFGLSVHAGV